MLNPLDLYDIRGLLTEDERMVQDSVGRFVDEKVLPVIQEHFENHTFPKELVPELAELGLLGSSIHGYDCADHSHRSDHLRVAGRRASAGHEHQRSQQHRVI